MTGDYYKTKESVTEYINLAKDVSGAQLIDKLKSYLASQSKLLEIGTGPGTDWNILKKDYDVVGSDNSLEFIKHLNEKYPEATFLNLDASSLETTEKFDGIYSNKVVHHLRDQELADSIERQSQILNPGGIICHSFWKGEGSEIFKGLFVNYHDEKSIQEFFQTRFEILLLEPYAEFEKNDSLLLIGKKI